MNKTFFRDYNSTLGQWLSKDPIEEEGGINLYEYALNAPSYLSDPLGLDVKAVYSVTKQAFSIVDNQTGAKASYDGKNYDDGPFSGNLGANDPSQERKCNCGPIPRGKWSIGPQASRMSTHNPNIVLPYKVVSYPLSPKRGTNTFGRTGFTIEQGAASDGCIVFRSYVNPSNTGYNPNPGFSAVQKILNNTAPLSNGSLGTLTVIR